MYSLQGPGWGTLTRQSPTSAPPVGCQPSRLQVMRKPVFGTGGLQVLLTGLVLGGLALLAGLVDTFEIVKEHGNSEIVMAMSKEPEYSDARIIEVALPRAEIFGLHYTAPDALAAWFHNEQRLITNDQLMDVDPIRDDLLIYEYFWRPR